MTELAALNVRITGDSGDLTAAVNSARGQLETLNKAAGQAQAGANRLGGGMGKLAGASNMLKGNVQNASFQLQDMAVQLQMGTRWTTVMAQQLPQLAGGFGAVGAVVGVLAAVGFSALGMAMTDTGQKVLEFTDHLDNLATITDKLKAAQDILAMSLPELYAQYGLYAGAVRDAAAALVELNIAQAQDALNAAVIDGADALGQYAGAANTAFSSGTTMAQGLLNIRDQFGLVGMEAHNLQQAFSQLQNAVGFDDQVAAARNLLAVMNELGIPVSKLPAELRNALVQANELTIAGAELKNEMGQAANAAAALSGAAPKAGWLSGAIADASTLASTLWDAAMARAAALDSGEVYASMGDDERGSQRGIGAEVGAMRSRDAVKGRMAGMAKSGGGGGGGGGTSQLQQEIAAMQEALMTQEQLQLESYVRQQEMLDQALAQRLITQEEYAGLMQQAQATHEFAMQQSVNKGVSDTLGALGQLFQGSKKISAGIALANSWLAFTEVLKDPAYIGRPWARMAAAGKALAAGLNAVKSIKSASPGGGGAGGASAGMGGAAPQQNVQTMNFTISNDPFGFGANMIRQLAAQLNEAQRNGSQIRANVR